MLLKGLKLSFSFIFNHFHWTKHTHTNPNPKTISFQQSKHSNEYNHTQNQINDRDFY